MDAALDIFLPVMESATVLAAHYAKACGRDIVIAEDMKLGLMYSARHVTGKQLGTLFPEIYDSDTESDAEGSAEEEDDPEWIMYEGPDDIATKMNECLNTWGVWEPESPAEHALKSAVDKMNK